MDLKRYDGHTPGPWTLCGHVGHYDPADPLVLHKMSEADRALLTDAPLLMARVVELEARIKETAFLLSCIDRRVYDGQEWVRADDVVRITLTKGDE
jgi:hypothetical protein